MHDSAIHALFSYAMSNIYSSCHNIYVCYMFICDDVIVFNLIFSGEGQVRSRDPIPVNNFDIIECLRCIVVVRRM